MDNGIWLGSFPNFILCCNMQSNVLLTEKRIDYIMFEIGIINVCLWRGHIESDETAHTSSLVD